MFIAVDFDGTCVTHEYPVVGRDIGAVPWLRKAQEMGADLILLTMRDGHELYEAVRWAALNGIVFHTVNENPAQASWTTSPKVYAHRYVDDAAMGAPLVYPEQGRPYVDWEIMGPALIAAIDQMKERGA
jgi:hypothetical protein